MPIEHCWKWICFFPLDKGGAEIFGFPDLIAGLAIMFLAWTIADVRYRFRVSVAPIPLHRLTFIVVAAIGSLTLLTDLWRAEGWYVPRGTLLTPAAWQSVLAGVFFLTFLAWAWFAFIRPPVFRARNAKRYAQSLYRLILKGSPADLAVVSDELALSIPALVHHAANVEASDRGKSPEEEPGVEPLAIESFANDILLLIGDRRFCRAVVESSPTTALFLFQEMADSKKFDIPVETFARNIVTHAILNKDSFLYHEAEAYDSGLIGYQKPLSQAIFGNFQLVESVGSLFDTYLSGSSDWDSQQWKAYCNATLITFKDYAEHYFWQHSFTLYRATGRIQQASWDLYKINGTEIWDSDVTRRLRAVTDFIKGAIAIMEEKKVPAPKPMRTKEKNVWRGQTFYDRLAEMIVDLIFHASAVTSPQDQCWSIQHNSVWSEFFNFDRLEGACGRLIKFKVRRLIYNEVIHLRKFPNFKGAKILGFCLNVMGTQPRKDKYDKDSYALHRAIISWTKKHYAWLHEYNPRIAAACLVEGMSYDRQRFLLVKTYPVKGLRREEHQIKLEVDKPRFRPDINGAYSLVPPAPF